MARKVATGIPTQNGSSHGHQRDGDVAPPSTIAAQIVHNRANVTREEPENQELFGRLLQEYLNDPIAEDASLETNAQLIHVVAEAGLDAVQKADPFAPNAAARRASDSLQVLELTIRRSPQILFYNGSDTSIDGASPPLILWLLPKILGLAGRDGTYSQVVSFLNTCVHLSLTGNQFWRRGQALLELIRIMIQGMAPPPPNPCIC
jgi:serine/threonine-protein kinase ATR